MKWILSLLLVLSFNVHAKKMSDEQRAAQFSERKAKALEMVGKKISALTELKSCIGSASDMKAIKECRKNHRSSTKEWRKGKKKRKQMRKKRKEMKSSDE